MKKREKRERGDHKSYLLDIIINFYCLTS